MAERDRRCSGDESEQRPARTEIDWPKMAKFFSDEFRAPRVPSCSDLNKEAARKGADKMVEAVETASAVLSERAGALILVASLVLTAVVISLGAAFLAVAVLVLLAAAAVIVA